MRLQYPFTYCELQKQGNISLLVKLVEAAYQKKEEDGAWIVITACLKLLVVLSLYKPTFIFLTQTFLVNVVVEIFIETVSKPLLLDCIRACLNLLCFFTNDENLRIVMLNRDFIRGVLRLIDSTPDLSTRACVRALLVDLSTELGFSGIIRQI